jgi:hypothetical protein
MCEHFHIEYLKRECLNVKVNIYIDLQTMTWKNINNFSFLFQMINYFITLITKIITTAH